MKVLTEKELREAPAKIQVIYIKSHFGIGISVSMFEEAIIEYPEYFPDEVEHKRKWDSVPQSIQDGYNKERELLRNVIYKDLPPSKGILGWINDAEGYEKWRIKSDECREKEMSLAKELHKKFFGQYGIEWNGI